MIDDIQPVVPFRFTNSSSASAGGAGKVSVFDLKIFYLALLQAFCRSEEKNTGGAKTTGFPGLAENINDA